MFEPLFALCILGSIVAIIFSLFLIFIEANSKKENETNKSIGIIIILALALGWTTSILGVNKNIRDRDEDAISNGVMRWVSDERGNLSRQWIKPAVGQWSKPVVTAETPVEIKK